MHHSVIHMPNVTQTVVEAEISDVVYRGLGLSRIDGRVVLIPRVLTGEKVHASIAKRYRNYDAATPTDILTPSPERTTPACPLFGNCPGCCYQHANYKEELRLKQRQFGQFIEHAMGEPVPLSEPVPSPLPLGYRNKIVVHADSRAATIGYFGEDNRTVVDVPSCPLAVKPINDMLSMLRTDKAFLSRARTHSAIIIRHTERNGVRVAVGKQGSDVPFLTETTDFGPLRVPMDGFFQVNNPVAALLVRHVSSIVETVHPDVFVDAYCGVGVFAISASRSGAKRIAGFDSDIQAIRAARLNSRDFGLSPDSFRTGTAARDLRATLDNFATGSVMVVLDPPRRGLDPGALDALTRRHPAHIVYVSCAADTLARDLAAIHKNGYTILSAGIFDMFPRTPYFESVVHLHRPN